MINHPEFMKIYNNFIISKYIFIHGNLNLSHCFIKNEKKIFIFKSNKGSFKAKELKINFVILVLLRLNNHNQMDWEFT